MSGKEDNTVEKKEETKKEETKEASSLWTPVWDSNAQAYYYWNTETNETTWENPLEKKDGSSSENPLDFLLDRIDNEVKKKLDDEDKQVDQTQQEQQQQQYYNGYYGDQYYDYNDYSTQAHFNSRTGRFTTQAEVERLNPEALSYAARATRQMNAYFDVEGYTEQRNAERLAGKVTKKKPLTRKEIEYFKKQKQEKKNKRAREWLLQ